MTMMDIPHPGPEARINVQDERALMDSLLDIAQRRLRPLGLSVDRQHAQMTLSGDGVPTGNFDVHARWDGERGIPALPLAFDLHPRSGAGMAGGVREAFLAAPLLRDTAVAVRRLRKGEALGCKDVAVESRVLRDAPKRPLAWPCQVDAGTVVLHDVGRGDALRVDDVGPSLDVMAGAEVVMEVAVHDVNITTTVIALSDGRAGDRVDVRLEHPTRILPARVKGPGVVRLEGSIQ